MSPTTLTSTTSNESAPEIRPLTSTVQDRDPSEAPESLRNRIRQFMAANLHRRPTLKDMAVFLGYSEKYCSDFFKVRMGEPFSQYGKRLRLEKAQCLLAEGQTTLAEIADGLGFSDQFAFSHFFKRAIGCAPNQFRLRSRKTRT